eukprot:scaffold51333_cov27-Tisochrysis_lutea.AAC.6
MPLSVSNTRRSSGDASDSARRRSASVDEAARMDSEPSAPECSPSLRIVSAGIPCTTKVGNVQASCFSLDAAGPPLGRSSWMRRDGVHSSSRALTRTTLSSSGEPLRFLRALGSDCLVGALPARLAARWPSSCSHSSTGWSSRRRSSAT